MAAPYRQWVPLGSFKVSSGRILVADPRFIFHPLTRSGTLNTRAKKGQWLAEVLKENGDVLLLRAWCEGSPATTDRPEKEEVWVDTGQVGIYDARPDWGKWGKRRKNEWYWEICVLTSPETQAGVLKGGCVSNTGNTLEGDFSILVGRQGKEAINVLIVFPNSSLRRK